MKVTKWSIYWGDFAVNEQHSEATSADTGPVKPVASEAGAAPVMAESPAIAPDQELTSPQADPLKVEAKVEPKIEPKEEPKLEAKVEPSKVEAPKPELTTEAARPEASRSSSKVTIMSPGERSWTGT